MSDSRMSENLKIATTLEKLVGISVDMLEIEMNALRLPPSIRVPMWEALARRAMQKAEDCRESNNAPT